MVKTIHFFISILTDSQSDQISLKASTDKTSAHLLTIGRLTSELRAMSRLARTEIDSQGPVQWKLYNWILPKLKDYSLQKDFLNLLYNIYNTNTYLPLPMVLWYHLNLYSTDRRMKYCEVGTFKWKGFCDEWMLMYST